MNYYKDVSGNVYAYDDEQVEQGLQGSLQEMTEEEVEAHKNPPLTQEQIVARYTHALERFYDSKAAERRYDSRLTCALRAGYAGPFYEEGAAFAVWMDNCNVYAYQVMAEVQDGSRPMPSEEELISELPELVWPT